MPTLDQTTRNWCKVNADYGRLVSSSPSPRGKKALRTLSSPTPLLLLQEANQLLHSRPVKPTGTCQPQHEQYTMKSEKKTNQKGQPPALNWRGWRWMKTIRGVIFLTGEEETTWVVQRVLESTGTYEELSRASSSEHMGRKAENRSRKSQHLYLA